MPTGPYISCSSRFPVFGEFLQGSIGKKIFFSNWIATVTIRNFVLSSDAALPVSRGCLIVSVCWSTLLIQLIAAITWRNRWWREKSLCYSRTDCLPRRSLIMPAYRFATSKSYTWDCTPYALQLSPSCWAFLCWLALIVLPPSAIAFLLPFWFSKLKVK